MIKLSHHQGHLLATMLKLSEEGIAERPKASDLCKSLGWDHILVFRLLRSLAKHELVTVLLDHDPDAPSRWTLTQTGRQTAKSIKTYMTTELTPDAKALLYKIGELRRSDSKDTTYYPEAIGTALGWSFKRTWHAFCSLELHGLAKSCKDHGPTTTFHLTDKGEAHKLVGPLDTKPTEPVYTVKEPGVDVATSDEQSDVFSELTKHEILASSEVFAIRPNEGIGLTNVKNMPTPRQIPNGEYRLQCQMIPSGPDAPDRGDMQGVLSCMLMVYIKASAKWVSVPISPHTKNVLLTILRQVNAPNLSWWVLQPKVVP